MINFLTLSIPVGVGRGGHFFGKEVTAERAPGAAHGGFLAHAPFCSQSHITQSLLWW